MKFTYALTALSALAGAAHSAPTVPGMCVVSTDLTLIEPPSGISQDVLFDVASPVGLIVSGLGLENVAPGLVGLVDDASTNITTPVIGALSEVTEIVGVAPELVTQLVQGLSGLKTTLESLVDEAVTAVITKVISTVEDLIGLLTDLVDVAIGGVAEIVGLDPALQVTGVDSGSLAILAQVSSPLSMLLCTLGLDALAPGLIALLSLLDALA